jgi:hypothetical protein
MTKKQIIERLSKFPEDAEVYVYDIDKKTKIEIMSVDLVTDFGGFGCVCVNFDDSCMRWERHEPVNGHTKCFRPIDQIVDACEVYRDNPQSHSCKPMDDWLKRVNDRINRQEK